MFIRGKYITVGGTTIPATLIQKDSYSAVLNRPIIDQWEDANTDIHITYAKHRRLHVSFTTSDMNESVMNQFCNIIKNACATNSSKVTVEAWVPALNDYVTQDCDVNEFEFVLSRYSPAYGNIYTGCAIEFNGRGGSV